MKNGYFEDEDLKNPIGIIQMLIALAVAVFIFVSCTSTKRIDTPIKPVTGTLDGSKSYDEDGYIVDWKWRQITPSNNVAVAKPNATTTTVSIKRKGTYRFELTVTDNHGAIGRDTATIKY